MSLMLSMCNEVKQVYLLNVTRTIEMEIPSAHLTVPHFFRIKHCTNFFHYFFYYILEKKVYIPAVFLLFFHGIALENKLEIIIMYRYEPFRFNEEKKHHYSFTRFLKFSEH
jgi:hypothetical protein